MPLTRLPRQNCGNHNIVITSSARDLLSHAVEGCRAKAFPWERKQIPPPAKAVVVMTIFLFDQRCLLIKAVRSALPFD